MMVRPSSHGRSALITGGTRGIGLGIARALVREGWELVLCGTRPESEVEATMEDLRRNASSVHYVAADIARAGDRKQVIDRVQAAIGAVNLLVNNAGRAPRMRADLL